jgi:hypothetical protein
MSCELRGDGPVMRAKVPKTSRVGCRLSGSRIGGTYDCVGSIPAVRLLGWTDVSELELTDVRVSELVC